MNKRTTLIVIAFIVLASTASLILPAFAQACPTGTPGDDNLTNTTDCTGNMTGLDGNDTMTNGDANWWTAQVGGNIEGGNGNDTITNNSGMGGSILGGDGNDSISNNGTGSVPSVIDGGTGDDSIYNEGRVYLEIQGGTGSDNIQNVGDVHQLINGGGDADTITNYGNIGTSHDDATLNGGDGNDIINNYGNVGNIAGAPYSGVIDGGNGNDTVTNYAGGDVATSILGGAGDDSMTNNGAIQLVVTDWQDNTTTTLGLFDGGADNDTMTNNGIVGTFAGGDGADTMTNSSTGSTTLMTGGAGNDSLTVSGMVLAVDAGANDDIVTLIDGVRVTLMNLDGGPGFDTLRFTFSVATWDEWNALQAIIDSGAFSSGNVSISGTQYTWQNFESLVNTIPQPTPPPTPEPTPEVTPEPTPEVTPEPTPPPPVVINIDIPVRTDGRMNWIHMSAPVALYCEAAMRTYTVYDTSRVGNRLLAVSMDEVVSAIDLAVAQGQNVVIASNAGVSLVALPTGIMQVVAGDYRFAITRGLCAPSV